MYLLFRLTLSKYTVLTFGNIALIQFCTASNINFKNFLKWLVTRLVTVALKASKNALCGWSLHWSPVEYD